MPGILVEDAAETMSQSSQRNQRLRGLKYPSDPQFDRTRFTDEEFIELLLSEIEELYGTISQLSTTTTMLKDLLIENNLPIPQKLDYALNLRDLRSAPLTPVDDIPQRSARRKLSQKMDERKEMLHGALKSIESLHSRDLSSDSAVYGESTITFDGQVDVSGGVPLTKSLKDELSAAVTAASSDTHIDQADEDLAPRKSEPESFGTLESAFTNNGMEENQLKNSDSPEALKIFSPKNMGSSSALSNDSKSLTLPASTNQSHRSSQHNFIYNKHRDSSRDAINTTVDRRHNSSKLTDQMPTQGVTPPWKIEQSNKKYGLEETRNISEQSSTYTGLETQLVDRGIPNDMKAPQTPDAFTNSFFSNSNKLFGKAAEAPRASNDSQSLDYSPARSPSRFYITGRNSSHLDIVKTPTAQIFSSTDSLQSPRKYTRTPGSSFQVSSPKLEDEVPLFIKPEEFHNIAIKVVSTIPTNSKKLDDPDCTFSITDKESGKEMWRVRKTYSQMVAFDNEIRPIVEIFGLPSLPDKSLFGSTTPLKIDSRKTSLQEYFSTIFSMPHMPQIVLHRFCRYVSLDFVNPLDDFRSGARKEGYLIRRYKSLGTTWKIRWCQVDGPSLEIYDCPGGNLLEEIVLTGSQIGRQSTESVAEERGYRHALLILGKTKGSKLSNSTPKHFLCAESDEERDEWISAMVEFTDNDPMKNVQGAEQSSITEFNSRGVDSLLLEGDVPEQLQSYVTNFDTDELNFKEQKELKRMKKRSIFSFKHKTTTEDSLSMSSDSTINAIPESNMQSYLMQMNLPEETTQQIFGRDLEEVHHLSPSFLDGLSIPSICYRCVIYLERTGAIYEEGIFRLSGSASTIRQLKERFNTSFDVDLFRSPLKPDIHTVAGLLKTFLRELPGPILGEKAYNEFQKYVTDSGSNLLRSDLALKMQEFLRNLNNINKIHYDCSCVIFKLLKSVINQSTINRMNLKNICIVFVPTLNISVEVLSICLTDYDCVFGNAAPLEDNERECVDIQIPYY